MKLRLYQLLDLLRFYWMKYTIVYYPDRVYGSYASAIGPKVILKMDIEGLEYVVLPDLVTSGSLCQTVDFCFGDLHPQYFFFPINRTATHGGLYLENAPDNPVVLALLF